MAPRQTKTPDRSPAAALSPGQIDRLRSGADRFNRGDYFEAHEEWEVRWRSLPVPHRPQVQAAILVCGVFVLLGKGRTEAAGRLARLAIERFAEAATAVRVHGEPVALSLPGAEDRLLRILARIRLGESGLEGLLSESEGLSAEVEI